MPVILSGILTIENMTKSKNFYINKPDNNNYVQLLGDFPSSVSSRSVIKANFYLSVSVLRNSNEYNRLNVPVKMENGSSSTSGLLKIYTSGGEYYPDFVVFDLYFSDKLSASSRVKVNPIEDEILNVISLGRTSIILNDAKFICNYAQSSEGLEEQYAVVDIVS